MFGGVKGRLKSSVRVWDRGVRYSFYLLIQPPSCIEPFSVSAQVFGERAETEQGGVR